MPKVSKSSKPSKRWGEFSEWVWEPEKQFWYRVRQDAEGNYDWDYATNPQEGLQESEPRSKHPSVDEVTERFQNHTLSPHSDPSESEYTVSGGQVSSSGGKQRTSRSSKDKDSSKHKGKRRDYDSHAPVPETTRGRGYRAAGEDEDEEEEEEDNYAYTAGPGEGYATGDRDYHTQFQQGTGSSSAYGASTSAYEPAYTVPTSHEHDPYANAAGATYSNYSAYEPIQDEGGRSTPRPHGHSAEYTTDVSEALDPRYRVEKSDRFQPGEIFKAGWAEPKGAANDLPTVLSGKQEIEDQRGVTFITGFRRFIVVANDHGHATCVPILSYGGKACTKRGLKPEKHGIIYQRGQRPKMLDREPKLGFQPVKADITLEGERLSAESRVNYSKLVTVEHNVKVMFIGSIVPSDWPIVPDAINRCWDQKDHHKRKSHRR